jgi:hypothetical protein
MLITRIATFLATHGNGFWLHGLGSIIIVFTFWYMIYQPLTGLVLSTVLWVGREALQHPPLNIFTFHRILEWGTPIITGLLTWGLLTLI